MIDIRQAVEADELAICSLDHIAQYDDKRKQFIIDAVSAGRCFVAVVDGNVVGFIVLEYTFYANGFISLLYVHPDFRRQGIGSELIRHVETICQTEKLFTSTNESNVPMQNILRKLGYVRSGTIDNLDKGDPECVYFKRPAKRT